MTHRHSLRSAAARSALPGLALALALAGCGSTPTDDDRIELDIERPPRAEHPIGPNLRLGAQLTMEPVLTTDLDLDRRVDDDTVTVTPTIEADVVWEPSPQVQGYLGLEATRRQLVVAPAGASRPATRLAVDEAWLMLRSPDDAFALQIGRQDFEDPREWLYDEELDGVRLYWAGQGVGIEASVSRERIVDKNLLDWERNPRVNNFFLLGHLEPWKDTRLTPYLLVRDAREQREETLRFVGIQGIGEIGRNVDYWVEAARVWGTRRGRPIKGQGFDVGFTAGSREGWRPSLSLGFAFGSGDDTGRDRVDRAFRQTGLQDNNARLGGIASFKYYGEVLEPELSNLAILTAGAGIRPTPDSSVELVYHAYRQHYADDDLRDSNLDVDPDGDHRFLGQGLDLVVGYRVGRDVTVEGVAGAFLPGPAFSSDADPSFRVSLELRMNF